MTLSTCGVRAALFVLFSVSLFPRHAAAADLKSSPVQGTRISLDARMLYGGFGETFAFSLNGQLEVRPGAILDLSLPFAVAQYQSEANPHGAFGNIVAGAHGAFPVGERWLVWLGGAAAVPTLYDTGSTGSSSMPVLIAASLFNQGLDPERYVPEYLVVAARVGVELHLGPPVRLRLELSPRGAFPVGRQTITGAVLHLQGWLEAEIQLPAPLLTGARLSGAWANTLPSSSFFVFRAMSAGGALFLGYRREGSGFEARLEGLFGIGEWHGSDFWSAGRMIQLGADVSLGYRF